jgi:FkbM family methyltransferase
MRHHPIFEHFQKVKCVGTGKHVFDFLGVATDVSYKKGWEKFAIRRGTQYAPDYPVVNEHYFDWIAMLQCVHSASGTFRMAELGAGWAPWLVRAVFAARQNSRITGLELVGVEADATHFGWMVDHFLDNDLNPDDFLLLHGAVSPRPETLKFPKISNPDEDYGASTRAVGKNSEYVEVRGYTLPDLLGRFSGPVDFVHMDIQGAEYDVIPESMALLRSQVKAIMVGTHLSLDKHDDLHRLFTQNGWEPVIVFARNGEITTDYGAVKFGDGFLYYQNPSVVLGA